MKKQKIFISLMLLFTTAFAQAQWEVQLDLQNFTPLDRIFFLDENYGWAIGGSIIEPPGPYFYTTDGGQNWYLSNDWMDLWGTDIVFVNPDTGFIASGNGIIYKTINGGQNWTGIQTPATQDVMRLFFVDESNGWATLGQYSEGNILHTENDGTTWELQKVFISNTSIVDAMFFLNDSIGYGSGIIFDYVNDNTYTAIMKTQNMGFSWDTIYFSENTFYSISDIYFDDTIVGWAVGSKATQDYLFLNTEDGGETWNEKVLPELKNWYGMPVEESIIYSIQFVNDTLGWLTCQDEYGAGYIVLTTDGGETWQQQFVNYNFNEPVYDICMVDNKNGWAVGGDYVYHTNNGDTIIVVGIGENPQGCDLITIAPNPCNGNTVHLVPGRPYNRPVEISIYDMTGSEVYKTDLQDLLNKQVIVLPVSISGSSLPLLLTIRDRQQIIFKQVILRQ